MSGRFAEDQIWAHFKSPCYIMLTGLLKNYKLSLMWCILLMRCNICSIVLKNLFFFFFELQICEASSIEGNNISTAQVLDLRRTQVRVHHATSYDSTFVMGQQRGARLWRLRSLCHCHFPTAINPFLFQITCQRGHTPYLTLFHKPSPFVPHNKA